MNLANRPPVDVILVHIFEFSASDGAAVVFALEQ